MKVFKENENNDIGKVEIIEGLDAVIQLARSAMEAQAGEMIFNAASGMPNEDITWNNTNLQQFDFFAIKTLKGVKGVTQVSGFQSEIKGDAVTYQATLTTVYGVGNLNGSL